MFSIFALNRSDCRLLFEVRLAFVRGDAHLEREVLPTERTHLKRWFPQCSIDTLILCITQTLQTALGASKSYGFETPDPSI